MLKLYSYFRSSAAYRVRIALNWKNLKYEYLPVHLIKDGGQQNSAGYSQVNPMGHVPALDHDGFLIAESVAIVQYLDDAFAGPRLFPMDVKNKAVTLQICEIINSGIQPLQNLKVNQYLETNVGQSKTDVERWNQHWINKGLASLEKVLEKSSGTYCVGGEFSSADCFLVPQCFSSRRFGVKIENYPTIARIEQACLKLPAVQAAHPEKQPDFAP